MAREREEWRTQDGWTDGWKQRRRGEERKTEEGLIPLAPPRSHQGALPRRGGAGAQKAEKNKKTPLKRLRFGFEEQMKGSDAAMVDSAHSGELTCPHRGVFV